MDQLFVTEKQGLVLALLLRTSREFVPHLFYEARTTLALLVVKKRGQLNLAKDIKNPTFCKVNSLNNNYTIGMLKMQSVCLFLKELHKFYDYCKMVNISKRAYIIPSHLLAETVICFSIFFKISPLPIKISKYYS